MKKSHNPLILCPPKDKVVQSGPTVTYRLVDISSTADNVAHSGNKMSYMYSRGDVIFYVALKRVKASACVLILINP